MNAAATSLLPVAPAPDDEASHALLKREDGTFMHLVRDILNTHPYYRISKEDLSKLLIRMVMAGDIDLVRRLLARGADIHYKYGAGGDCWTVVKAAAERGQLGVLRELIDRGADADDAAALAAATRAGDAAIVSMLLAAGAKPDSLEPGDLIKMQSLRIKALEEENARLKKDYAFLTPHILESARRGLKRQHAD